MKEEKYLELADFPKSKIVDLTGRRFSKLTVVEFNIDRYKNNRCKHYWNCDCDCGNKVIIDKYSLINGISIMCEACASIEMEDTCKQSNN